MKLGFFGQAKYLVDEAKDKNDRILDVSKWDSVFPQEIPEQLNGYAYEFFADFFRICTPCVQCNFCNITCPR